MLDYPTGSNVITVSSKREAEEIEAERQREGLEDVTLLFLKLDDGATNQRI